MRRTEGGTKMDKNANLIVDTYEYNGRTYTSLRLEVELKNGDVMKFPVKINPYNKDSKTIAKMLYKIKANI